MPDYIPQVGSIDTTGTGNDGLESERIKTLTQDDIGYGTDPIVTTSITVPETDSGELLGRIETLETTTETLEQTASDLDGRVTALEGP